MPWSESLRSELQQEFEDAQYLQSDWHDFPHGVCVHTEDRHTYTRTTDADIRERILETANSVPRWLVADLVRASGLDPNEHGHCITVGRVLGATPDWRATSFAGQRFWTNDTLLLQLLDGYDRVLLKRATGSSWVAAILRRAGWTRAGRAHGAAWLPPCSGESV